MCYVDQFLKGANQFKGLFLQCNSEEDTEKPLTIPFELHCEDGANIFVGDDDGGITRLLLTSKNLTNPQDISSETLYRHAKEVEANCKKALSICLKADSPWRNFDGHYESGKGWFDYLEWLRIEMYRSTNSCTTSDILDVDLDKQPVEEEEDVGRTQGDKNQHDNKEHTFLKEILNEEADTNDVPDNEYFKGFWAFAMWGFIPPPGHEEYKCTLIATVVDEGKKKAVV